MQNHDLNKEWRANHFSTYVHTDMEATYFWDYTFFPFSLRGWFDPTDSAQSLAGWLRCLQARAPSEIGKKRGLKKLKEAPCCHLWSLSVTAWWAISSSPTEAVSYAAGRRPERPPAPRTLAAAAAGLCSTWPRPGMTSAGRGKWRGRGEGGTVSSHRLRTKKQNQSFNHFGL